VAAGSKTARYKILASVKSLRAMGEATWFVAAIVALKVLEAIHVSAILPGWVLPI